MAKKKNNPHFKVDFFAKSAAAKVKAITVSVFADNEDEAIILAKQHTLINSSRWNVSAEKVS